MMAGGNPNNWPWSMLSNNNNNINNMHYPQSQQLSSPNYLSSLPQHLFGASPPPSNSLPDHLPSQEFPRSWSQLLMGDQEKYIGASPYPYKQETNWELDQEGGQMINPANNTVGDGIKQEAVVVLHHQSLGQLYGQVAAAAAGGGHNHGLFSSGPNSSVSWSRHQGQEVPVSSPNSCLTTLSSNVFNFTTCRLERKYQRADQSNSECNSTGAAGGAPKKARVQHSSTQPALKVRKEKLGDRITALHQIVSPFGKTDTASVLSEAIGYIRFLLGQIEALGSPYLGNASGSIGQQQPVQERNCLFQEEAGQFLDTNCLKRRGAPTQEVPNRGKDLKSRGLCLVPVSFTQHVGSDSSADYWAPALAGGGF